MKQPVHVRTIRVEAVESGPRELEVRGTLLDERPRGERRWQGDDGARIIHDMTVTLRVRYPDFVITEARAGMAAFPYTICPEARPSGASGMPRGTPTISGSSTPARPGARTARCTRSSRRAT